ncbi:MAG: YgiQ family radical SAM protein [Clostridia bacterium]|nr:YgiQ family radical SAM protein [Clostridia bacterium]MBQ8743509.1 YgiQ family radical SAM protein [Clostridia bacterium]
MGDSFLPVTRDECTLLGWDVPDFVYVTGDAYVDHPSFGTAIISRVLENAGFRIAILSQPDYKSCEDFKRFGRPRLGFLVSAGNIDSMVAHYTAAKKKRSYDYYSPGGRIGLRPDRATIVYSNRIREAYGDVPIILGGLEASLRRFSHYDYWENRIRRSVLVDSRADILTYGMGENILVRIAKLLDKGVPIKKIRDVRGTVYLARPGDALHFESVECPSFEEIKNDKKAYARAFGIQYMEQDAIRGRAVVESYGDKILVQNPPMPPLEREELDKVYSLPYTRKWHPMYQKDGGVPGIQEVEFSITHNRGCFGACNFCALAFHQGRSVRSRSMESVVAEAKLITEMPGFKGYIHDVGGPTANFRYPACDKQLKDGVCAQRKCLTPTPCKNLKVDHSEYTELLSQIESLPKVKKVFVRSGIRFDYLVYDKDETFFKKLVRDHVSGQLKVAPEHCSDHVLKCMGKPSIEVYDRFKKRFFEITKEFGKEQYLVPYLMSSHPGSRLSDAVELAEYLKRTGCSPEQVQDYYPTPGTASTVMFYTGIDPLTMKEVYCESDYHSKMMQRALLQYNRPENADIVREALIKCGREDLIGSTPNCLVRAKYAPKGDPKRYDQPKSKKGNQKRASASTNRQNHPNGAKKGARTDKKK